jgi:prepilin-type N-terminal cleavage/methylation domain-containing protein
VINRICRRQRSDEGFTLIELSVAMVVTLLVATSLVTVFLSSISGVALAKQRQAATGLATAVMEKFRSLDYGTLSAGLYCSDLSGDPNVTVSGTCGAGGTVTFAPAGTGISETLQVQSTTVPAASTPPIYPHSVANTTTKIDGIQYTVRSYVTQAATTASSFNLTVLVTWSSTVSHGATKTVTQRSLEFSPSRCLSSATHPYSGACQAAFNGDAGISNAAITINAIDPSGNIVGFDGASLELSLPGLSSSMGVEQITKLTGMARPTTATVESDSGTSTTGGSSATIAADSDPSSGSSTTDTDTVSQSASTLSLTGTAGAMTVTPSTADSGNLDGRVSSSATSCQDATGSTMSATNRPCSWGNVQRAGTAGSIAVQLANGAPNFSLASLAASPSPARASTAAIATSGGTACPTASGAGCVTAQSSRTMGTVSLGGLPTSNAGDSPPSGWGGSLLSVTGLSESAYAESGIGARTPSFTRSAGTLTYYDPTTHTMKTLNLATLATTTTVDLGEFTADYKSGGHDVRIVMGGQFSAGAAAAIAPTTTATDPACKTAACTATATPASTLTATITYDISVDGVQATAFAMTVDLGACIARSSYTAAFDA